MVILDSEFFLDTAEAIEPSLRFLHKRKGSKRTVPLLPRNLLWLLKKGIIEDMF